MIHWISPQSLNPFPTLAGGKGRPLPSLLLLGSCGFGASERRRTVWMWSGAGGPGGGLEARATGAFACPDRPTREAEPSRAHSAQPSRSRGVPEPGPPAPLPTPPRNPLPPSRGERDAPSRFFASLAECVSGASERRRTVWMWSGAGSPGGGLEARATGAFACPDRPMREAEPSRAHSAEPSRLRGVPEPGPPAPLPTPPRTPLPPSGGKGTPPPEGRHELSSPELRITRADSAA